jgi:hypothetical protein
MKFFTTICLVFAGAAQASLEWADPVQVLSVHPMQVSAPAVFAFTNGGPEVVSITDVRVSCGCVKTALARSDYAPGEGGGLRIDFDLQNRTGSQHKSVVVQTSDGLETTLQLECNIPPAYDSGSRMVVWNKEDSAESKTVRLVNSGAVPIKLLSAISSHEAISAELKPLREGFEYDVIMRHNGSGGTVRSVIRIATEIPPGQTESKTIKLYATAQ